MLEINKIHLGDSYELIKEIPDKSVDCVYTDIPYLYETGGAGKSELSKRCVKQKMSLQGTIDLYDKNKGNQENLRIGKNKKNSYSELIASDITNGIDIEKFIEEAFRVMKKPNIFIWCSRMQIIEIMTLLQEKTGRAPEILVWCKTNPIPVTNNLWLSDVEYCIYARKDIKVNDGYEIKSKWYSSPINKSDKDLYSHPTIKPLDLVKRHLLHTTKVGGGYS